MSLAHFHAATYTTDTATGIVFVDFFADWCGPCKAMMPIVEELAAEYAGRISFGKVDADSDGELAGNLGIQGIPTFLIYKDGVVMARLSGVKPKAALVAELEKLLVANDHEVKAVPIEA